jgi:hypothetical protein
MENGKWEMEERFIFTFSIFHFPFSIRTDAKPQAAAPCYSPALA